MIRNIFISAFRSVMRHPWLNAINVIGFAIGITCCLVIGLYVLEELSYDRHNANFNRIYRVALDRIYPDRNVVWAGVGPGVRGGLLAEIPEVEDATRVMSFDGFVKPQNEIQRVKERIAVVDTSFLNVFTVKFRKGDPATALRDPKSVILTQHAAEKYFAGVDPMGKTMEFDFYGLLTVTGVVDDVPSQSHFHYNFIIPISADAHIDESWGSSFGFYTYILLNPNVSPEAVEAKFPAMTDKYLSREEASPAAYAKWIKENNQYRYFMQPIGEIHLRSDFRWEMEPNGSLSSVYLFSGIGLLILIIACINFMNLSTARYSTRVKEVGLRKILGSMRIQLMGQFVLESMVLSFIALGIGLVIMEISLQAINGILGKNLSFDYTATPVIPGLVGFAFVIGLISGSYPAVLLSAFKPSHILNSNSSATSIKSKFRNRLVVAQFAISFFLIVGTIAVFSQMRYMSDKKLGYERENVIVIDNAAQIPNKETFREELMRNPQIQNVALSSEVPGQMTGAATFSNKSAAMPTDVNVTTLFGDENIIATWKLEVVSGRGFRAADYEDTIRSVILNETAVKQFGFIGDPIGAHLTDQRNQKLMVVGIVRDFHIESLHREIRPLVYLPNKRWVNSVAVRVATEDMAGMVSFVQNKWKTLVPEKPFEFFFLDDHYDALYNAEKTTSRLFVLFSCLALFIASLGLFGLSSFMSEQRSKEIGIRKVLGASVPGIVIMIIRDITRLIMIAILISIPASWYIISRWLESFTYRVHMGTLPYIIAGIAVLLIAVITISLQAIRSARVNPANALRNE